MAIDTPQYQDDATGILKWPVAKVYVRASLKTGTWTEVLHLDPIELSEKACPSYSHATFVYRAGSVMHTDDDEFVDRNPQDLLGQFVRVDMIDQQYNEDGTPKAPTDADLLRSWVGWFATDDREIGAAGSDGSAPQPVDQQLVAIGLEEYLNLVTIYGAWMYDRSVADSGDPEGQHIASALAFNEQGQVNLKKYGNRSADKIKVKDSDPQRLAYAFDALPRADGSASDVWTVQDIVEYLINFHFLDFDIGLPMIDPGGDSDADAAQIAIGDALAEIKPMRFMAEGMTLKQGLDRLLRPERGVGWCLRTDQSTVVGTDDGPVDVKLHVFPILSTPLTINTTTLPANSEQMSIDTTTDANVQLCIVGQEKAEQYGYVFAVGERVLSCFSLAEKDGTLEADWTTKEEADYKTVATREVAKDDSSYDGPPPEVDDLDNLQHVYCRYRIPYAWDGKAGDGMGGSKTLVNPKLDNDGAATANAATLNRQMRGFDEFLPIESAQRPADADYNPAAQILFRKAFAVVRWSKDTSNTTTPNYIDRWGFTDRMPATAAETFTFTPPSLDIYLPPDRHAIELRGTASHVMANDVGWTVPIDDFIKGSGVPAVYAWQEVIATVSLRTDERLYCYRTIDGATTSRKLYIDVPDAELWMIAANTVTGINGDGTLKRQATATRPRDDTPRLKQIADMAQAWYGQPRQSVQIQWGGCKTGFVIGGYIANVAMAGGEPINLCLTEARYNFIDRTTAIAANYKDLDLAGLR